MLAVIDYGAGNLRSVLHALSFLDARDIKLVREPHELDGAKKIILPGVGAFGAGMQQLHKQQLVDPIKDAAAAGVPYLGICVGMQFLFDVSEEMGTHKGLGLIEGRVIRFPQDADLKVPHMGWNQLNVERQTQLFDEVSEGSYAYFVHSYYCVPDNAEDTIVTSDYGNPFAAAVQRNNIYGVQFHPEKSQKTGLKILANFLNM